MIEITHDYIHEDSPSQVGIKIEEQPMYAIEIIMGESSTLIGAPKRVPFKLYDDDGELYYAGTLDDDNDCANQSAALRWGEAMAGCTTIKVKRDGTWVQEIA